MKQEGTEEQRRDGRENKKWKGCLLSPFEFVNRVINS